MQLKDLGKFISCVVIVLALSGSVAYADAISPETYGPGPSTPSDAGAGDQKLDKACKPGFFKAQKGVVDTNRAREKGYDTEMIKQPDSVLTLTCFDQGLKQTSKLGRIFSDVKSTVLPSLSMWGLLRSGLFSSGGGGMQTLGSSLAMAVVPQLSNFVGNFGSSLLSSLGGELLDIFPSWSGDMAATPSDMNCDRVNVLNETAVKRGPLDTVPYILINTLLSSGGLGGGGGAGFLAQMGGNSALLSTAMQSLQMFSAPNMGGMMSSMPGIPRQATTQAIINLMR